MKRKILSLLLVLVLVATMIPMPATASSTNPEAARLESQIKSVYKASLRGSGRKSFNGYCAAMVNWMTYLLGIDTQRHGVDGKDEYDLYKSLGTTTGGYRVRCYSASRYSLKSALNAITKNGTVDAYNILVGFQKTNTTLGKKYGHAMLIHGIVDGQVYFTESYNSYIDGKHWKEGVPISCSIDAFCEYYNRWTTFEGVAYFGLKNYAEACQVFPTNYYAMAASSVSLYREPSDPGIYDAEPLNQCLYAGEIIRVENLLKTPGGGYWYRLRYEGQTVYALADRFAFVQDCADEVNVSKLKLPSALNKSASFHLSGVLSTVNAALYHVNVSVYSADDLTKPVFSGGLDADKNIVNLSADKLDKKMTFSKLAKGTYYLKITADTGSYRFENGRHVEYADDVTVMQVEFKVVSDRKKYVNLRYECNGGSVDVASIPVKKGSALEELPLPSRPGYMFKGWTLDAEGNVPAEAGMILSENTVLYAQWKDVPEILDGWHFSDEGWSYYESDVPVQGWFLYNNIRFYQDENGVTAKGWKELGGVWYYFNDYGAPLTGWQMVDGAQYFFLGDGRRVSGWVNFGQDEFYFDLDGKLLPEYTNNGKGQSYVEVTQLHYERHASMNGGVNVSCPDFYQYSLLE